jgi:hypothetical protein
MVLPFADEHLVTSVRPRPSGPVPRKRRRTDKSFAHILAALEEPNRVLFLDVETTGLSRHYNDLTLVGWLADGVYRVYVAGDDPEPLHPHFAGLRPWSPSTELCSTWLSLLSRSLGFRCRRPTLIFAFLPGASA